MFLVSCAIPMQRNANTCYIHMQEIANTCMSNNFQLLCVSSSRGSALQQHPFPLWPIFLQGRQQRDERTHLLSNTTVPMRDGFTIQRQSSPQARRLTI